MKKDKNGNFIEQKINYLPAHFYQGIPMQIQSNIKTLSTLKENGFKVGKLKPKSDCDCININQYQIDYKIYPSYNKIHIAGIKKDIKVSGLRQIPIDAEICNAKLLKKASGYYLKITTYTNTQPSIKTGKSVGIDMNISNTLTTSDGKIIDKISIGETEQMKRLIRRIHKRTKKGSNNRYKLRLKYQRLYKHITNKKDDIANKIVHDLLTNYDEIYIQDEMLEQWHKNQYCSKIVQHSCLGHIKSKLRESSKVFMIDKSYPTTQLCSCCGHKQKLSLDDRQYICPNCGNNIKRDINSALNIFQIGQKLKYIGMERTDFKPVENSTSRKSDKKLSEPKYNSMKQEALNP